MKKSFGLCGQIPRGMNIQSTEAGQLQGTMPAGACPGDHATHIIRHIQTDNQVLVAIIVMSAPNLTCLICKLNSSRPNNSVA